jgi:hypothetical protein
MRVIVEQHVRLSIIEFYAISMQLHPTLDEATVQAKIDRLMAAMHDLERFYSIHPDARLKHSWIAAGYKEVIVEDFHIAYKVETDEDGEQYVAIHDAVHSLLYRE